MNKPLESTVSFFESFAIKKETLEQKNKALKDKKDPGTANDVENDAHEILRKKKKALQIERTKKQNRLYYGIISGQRLLPHSFAQLGPEMEGVGSHLLSDKTK